MKRAYLDVRVVQKWVLMMEKQEKSSFDVNKLYISPSDVDNFPLETLEIDNSWNDIIYGCDKRGY
jgi:hypothetical protein